MALKAVLFDFWKTVVDFGGDEELEKLADIRSKLVAGLLKSQGIEKTPEAVKQTIREVDREADKIRFGRNREVTSETVVRQVLKKLGVEVELNPLFLEQVWKEYTDSLLAIAIGMKPGADRVIRQLMAKGYLIGLVSNTAYGDKLRTILDKFGIGSYFGCMLFSDEFGIRKPRPEIFLAALEKLGVEPGQAVHIGDRVDLDVQGAKNAGIYSIYLDEDNQPYPEGFPRPDITVHGLNEVAEAVEEINVRSKT